MPKTNAVLNRFNRGLISPLGLARVDLEQAPWFSETQHNWMPRVLGSMMLRPGLGYIATTKSNLKAYHVPFVFSLSDTAIIEFTDNSMRVRVSETIITRPSVSSAVENTAFNQHILTEDGNFNNGSPGWSVGAGWSIGAGVATATLASSNLTRTSLITLIAGASYSITYTITRSAGSVTPTIGGTSGTTRSAAGTYTETIVSTSGNTIGFTGAGFTGTVDDISVVPVGHGWIDNDDGGTTSTFGASGLLLVGTGTSYARVRQEVTVAVGDRNIEHALRIYISRGEVTLRVGSTTGGEEYISAAVLTEGIHSIAFTPTNNFHIEFSSNTVYASIATSCAVESAGAMDITTVYNDTDLKYIRYTQSGDVVYLACNGYQQYKVQRFGTRSWSLVKYQPEDGPFRNINITPTTISASAVTGDVTLTSTLPVFKSTHPGALFKLSSVGQLVTSSLTGENQFTNYIKVIGTGSQRAFDIIRSGTWSATLTLQRSVGAPGAWVDVVGATYTTNGTTTYQDTLNNQEIYYRVGIKTGAYTSGTLVASLSYDTGSITGVVRITGYVSSTSATAVVLEDLGNTSGTADWYEGAWSDRRGYPSAVALSEGRLFWAGKDKVWGSVSDAFESFDSETEGDSGPISRSIGEGPVDTINWLLPLSRLIIGAQGAEWSVKSTTFDEPLTPTNFTIKAPSTQGSAAVAAFKVDDRGIFVDHTGRHLYQIFYDVNAYDFLSDDMTKMIDGIIDSNIVRIAVQRKPDTRIHCVLDDGTVVIYVYDRVENVKCWVTMDTPEASGLVEDAFVMPGTSGEDLVYYVVKRTVNGSTVRYLEKWALESECQGGTLNKQADSFIEVTQASSTTVSVPHLIGEDVVVWAGGEDLGTYTVSGGGTITVSEAVTSAIVGLPYTAQFKSTKLAYAAGMGTALNQRKRLASMGLTLYNTHHLGLEYGEDFTNMDDIPLVIEDEEVTAGTIWSHKDLDMMEFNSTWGTDGRLCLRATAPRPCTILGCTITVQTNDHG